MIGIHLIMDGVLAHRIGEEEVRRALSELPAEIGMKILAGPIVVEGDPENPGWTGVVVIEKSHIAIHTFEKGCKPPSMSSPAKPSRKRRYSDTLRSASPSGRST